MRIDERTQAGIAHLLEAIDVGYPHDDCCLRSDGHMPTCNKWKHEVIRRAATLRDCLESEGWPRGGLSVPCGGAAGF